MPADALSAGTVGYHGKLPARADFVSDGLPQPVVALWDAWLQEALAASQAALGEAWPAAYRTAPLWRFALAGGVCGASALIGVLMPSVDAVGRCFPLTIAQAVTAADPFGLLTGSGRWFAAAEARALGALDPAADPRELGAPLPAPGLAVRGRIGLPAIEEGRAGIWLPLPSVAAAGPVLDAALEGQAPGGRCALWCTTGAPGVPPGLALTRGLILPEGFAAMLDGGWDRHGWSAAPEHAEAAGWDREA